MFGKVNFKGGATGGWPHFVKPTTFAKYWGRYSPSRVRYAAKAPLTGFHQIITVKLLESLTGRFRLCSLSFLRKQILSFDNG